MAPIAGGPVVAGVDGSPSGLDAVELAAREAALRHLRLHIVHAFLWPATLAAARPEGGGPAPAVVFRARADAIVGQARERAAKAAPDIPISTEVASGPPSFVLLRRSRQAALIVVGDRGLGRFDGLLAGSVALHLATYGSCPVIVVRGRPEPDGPVVAGVDGSPRSARALEFAAEAAARRGAELVAVHAWRTLSLAGHVVPAGRDVELLADAEHRRLTTVLADLADRHPGVPVRPELVRGAAGRVLTDRSRQAQLLVVGDRGHGGFAGLLIGSVSQHLIFHSACPVAVVRDAPGPG